MVSRDGAPTFLAAAQEMGRYQRFGLVDPQRAIQTDAHGHPLADQLRRDAVAIAAHIDVAVIGHPAKLEVGSVVADLRQWLEGRSFRAQTVRLPLL